MIIKSRNLFGGDGHTDKQTRIVNSRPSPQFLGLGKKAQNYYKRTKHCVIKANSLPQSGKFIQACSLVVLVTFSMSTLNLTKVPYTGLNMIETLDQALG